LASGGTSGIGKLKSFSGDSNAWLEKRITDMGGISLLSSFYSTRTVMEMNKLVCVVKKLIMKTKYDNRVGQVLLFIL
jgi:hypothetical protein